ncbi:hypothetical protein GOP47_0028777 [Adiantum capillus-veneris]|nr:hypothetical protein GOP47_0028777 [Adiantum capillus-veneris]
MLPVRVKVLSSTSCSLSQASSLLQRFLSGDACSDSLARDYAANVAQALQDSISRRARASGSPLNPHRHFPSSSSHPSGKELVDGTQSISATELPTSPSAQAKLHGFEKQRSQAGKWKPRSITTVDDGEAAGSTIEEAETAHKRHKKKRRRSAVENGTKMVSPFMQEADDSVVEHHDKKRRKKEKAEREADHIASEKSTPATQKSGKKRMIELFGTDDITPDNQNRRKKEKIDRGGEHMAIENVTSDRERHHEKKKRKDRQEAEINSIELASPSSNDKKSSEKVKRKKEKQGKDAENMQVVDIRSPLTDSLLTESAVKKKKKRDAGSLELASPSANDKRSSEKVKRKKEKQGKDAENVQVVDIASPLTDSLLTKSAVKKKKKRDAGSLEANGITEAGNSVLPMSPAVIEKEGLKRKKKGNEAGLATPIKSTSKNITVETDAEAMPVNFDNVDSEEKRRKKKKRTRNVEPEFD